MDLLNDVLGDIGDLLGGADVSGRVTVGDSRTGAVLTVGQPQPVAGWPMLLLIAALAFFIGRSVGK